MVKLMKQWSTDEPPMTLGAAIEWAMDRQQDLLREKSLSVDFDVADELKDTSCSERIQSAFQYLISLAATRSPRGGEIQVSACVTGRGLEIEVADEGDETVFPRLNAFSPHDCRQAINFPVGHQDLGVFGAACPQGGMAWTLVVTHRWSASKVA